jgi:hypothetical protein
LNKGYCLASVIVLVPCNPETGVVEVNVNPPVQLKLVTVPERFSWLLVSVSPLNDHVPVVTGDVEQAFGVLVYVIVPTPPACNSITLAVSQEGNNAKAFCGVCVGSEANTNSIAFILYLPIIVVEDTAQLSFVLLLFLQDISTPQTIAMTKRYFFIKKLIFVNVKNVGGFILLFNWYK